MKIAIKYKKSRFLESVSKVTVLQDGLTMSLNGSYYAVDGEYYYHHTPEQVSIVASNEDEFKSYLIDEVLPSRLSKLLSYFKSKLI